LQQYNLLIKNKSAALKKGRTEKKYEAVIPIWNNHIAQYGGEIAFLRLRAIDMLNVYMKKEIEQITVSKESSSLTYKTFCSYSNDVDEKFFQVELKERLEQGINKEINLAQCLYGPHRDDFEILLNDMNSRQYCSQGQQRTLALSLIIAELLFVEETRGEKPVLLLDDVMSELDLKRQEYLIRGLYDVQTIITTTDSLPFNNLKGRNLKSFYIENGCVSYIS
jgi:DNA replication and repair protein RecF